MGEIIRNWFLNELGFTSNPNGFQDYKVYYVIPYILHYYGHIQEKEIPADYERDSDKAENIRLVLNHLGIKLSRKCFHEIMSGEKQGGLNLLYEMYLILEKEEKQKLKSIGDKFVEEIVDNVKTIGDYKNKYNSLKLACVKAKNDYLEYFRNKHAKEKCNEIVKFNDLKDDDGCLTDDIKFETDKLKAIIPNANLAKDIIKDIKVRKYRERKECKATPLENYLENLINKQDIRKLLEQTIYERQLITSSQNEKLVEQKMLAAKRELINLINQARPEMLKKRAGGVTSPEVEERLQLHRKLYEQRKEIKHLRNIKRCSDVTKDLVDTAIYIGEYHSHNDEEVPSYIKNDLTDMFIKSQPVYLSSQYSVDDSLNVFWKFPEEDENIEELHETDFDKPSGVDKLYLDEYLLEMGPWSNDSLDDFTVKKLNDGANVLGFIIHRILNAKYPLTLPPPPPAIPKPTVAVCVDGFNLEYLAILRHLLAPRKINVVQMQDAFEYCVNAWIDESTVEYPEESTEEFVEKKGRRGSRDKGKKDKSRRESKDKGKKDKSRSKSKDKSRKGSKDRKPLEEPKTRDVKLQTPKIFPSEELILSQAAILGRDGTENKPPTNELLVAMLVEYLRSLKDIEGWVLLNYPQNIEQAALLEFGLNTIPIPKSITSSNCVKTSDVPKYKQQSKLLKNPKPVEVSPYRTYLTGCIELKIATLDDIYEQYDQLLSAEKSDLQTFYEEQGCFYTLYYKAFDFSTIKRLGRLIMGNFDIPRKLSTEIFGDIVFAAEKEWTTMHQKPPKKGSVTKKGKKKEKGKKEKKGTLSTGSKGSKKKGKKGKEKSRETQTLIISFDQQQKQELQLKISTDTSQAVPQPTPGEDGWIYVNLPLLESTQIELASIWENTEEMYIDQSLQLFYRRRLLETYYIPYKAYVKECLDNCIYESDNRDSVLHKFRLRYNRTELKGELRDALVNFRDSLWEMCDDKMKKSNAVRLRFLNNDFMEEFLHSLIVIYCQSLQLEVNRCLDTVQVLIDYYYAMVSDENSNTALKKMVLNCNELYTNKNEHQYFLKTFLDVPLSNDYHTPYHDIIQKNVNTCLNKITEYREVYLDVAAKLNAIFEPRLKNVKSSLRITEPLPEIKDRAGELLSELTVALEAELLRAEHRIELIRVKCTEDFEQVLESAQKFFYSLFKLIKDNYTTEVKSIDDCVKYFENAIIADTKVINRLSIEDGRFIKEHLLSDPSRTQLAKRLPCFTLSQLNHMVDVLQELSPQGIMLQTTFIYIIQELLDTEALWTKLPVHKIVQEIFQQSEFINWRDFIVYTLNLTYPDEFELLESRRNFRNKDLAKTEIVTTEVFMNTPLWFDNVCDPDYLSSIKHLLVKMYKVEAGFHYTLFLLDFCKDEEITCALSKAMTLSTGKLYAWNETLGLPAYEQEYKMKLQADKEAKERAIDHEDTVKMAEELFESLTDLTWQRTDGVFLEEIPTIIINVSPQPSESLIFKYLEGIEKDHLEESSLSSFTNLSQGFESVDTILNYYLDLNVLIHILTVTLPWDVKNDGKHGIGDISTIVYNNLKDSSYKGVFIYQFFQESLFQDCIKKYYRFSIIDPNAIVTKLSSSS